MLLLLALVIVGDAEPLPDARLTRGLAALEALEYDDAALELTLAAADPKATEAQKVKANLYAGIAHRVLGQDTEARLNFVYVLRRAPTTELPPNTPPKITAFFDLVKEELGVPERTVGAPGVKPAPSASSPSAASPSSSSPSVPSPSMPSSSPSASSPSASSPASVAPLVLAGVGAVVAVGGLTALAVGAGPFFAHDSAVDGLSRASASGVDGSALQAQQIESRKEWTEWGQLTTVLGAGSVVLGAVVAGVALAYSNAP